MIISFAPEEGLSRKPKYWANLIVMVIQVFLTELFDRLAFGINPAAMIFILTDLPRAIMTWTSDQRLQKLSLALRCQRIDLVTVFEAILTSRQAREKLQCFYENLMSNNFRKTTVLKKIWIFN